MKLDTKMKPNKNLPNWGGLISVLDDHLPRKRPVKGIEVGMWCGENSESLLTRYLRLELIGVDPYDDTIPCKNKISFQKAERLAVLRLAPYWERFRWLKLHSEDAFPLFTDASFDFVFIDADHRYEGVKADILGWMPKVKKGGIIAGHDYKVPGRRHPGVKRAVNEIFGDDVNVIPMPCTVWWKQV